MDSEHISESKTIKQLKLKSKIRINNKRQNKMHKNIMYTYKYLDYQFYYIKSRKLF